MTRPRSQIAPRWPLAPEDEELGRGLTFGRDGLVDGNLEPSLIPRLDDLPAHGDPLPMEEHSRRNKRLRSRGNSIRRLGADGDEPAGERRAGENRGERRICELSVLARTQH